MNQFRFERYGFGAEPALVQMQKVVGEAGPIYYFPDAAVPAFVDYIKNLKVTVTPALDGNLAVLGAAGQYDAIRWLNCELDAGRRLLLPRDIYTNPSAQLHTVQVPTATIKVDQQNIYRAASTPDYGIVMEVAFYRAPSNPRAPEANNPKLLSHAEVLAAAKARGSDAYSCQSIPGSVVSTGSGVNIKKLALIAGGALVLWFVARKLFGRRYTANRGSVLKALKKKFKGLAGFRRGVLVHRGKRIGRIKAPARYERLGAKRASQYAWPFGYMYPIHDVKHVRAAARHFGMHKQRYPKVMRDVIAFRIARAKHRFGVGEFKKNAGTAMSFSYMGRNVLLEPTSVGWYWRFIYAKSMGPKTGPFAQYWDAERDAKASLRAGTHLLTR